MRRAPDPAWIGFAERLFAAFLWLFPSDLRRDHGDEMRQVFRDRCREVAGQPARIAHLLFAEMLPDTVASVSEAQWSAGIGDPRRRHGIALAVLSLAAGWLVFNDSVSRFVLDWGFEAKYWVENRQQEAAFAAQEAQVRSFADTLASEGTPTSRALAAYLYRDLYANRLGFQASGENRGRYPRTHYRQGFGLLPEDGAKATQSLSAISAGTVVPWIATVVLQSCEPAAGCNRGKAIALLTSREPDNAFAWAQAFKAASLAGDDAGKRDALSHMATARYYDDHLGAIRSAVFAASARLLSKDPHRSALVARYVAEASSVDTEDYPHDVRLACRSNSGGWEKPSLGEIDAAVAESCLHFARLLASSDGPRNAALGWREIDLREPTPMSARAYQQARALNRYGGTAGASPRGGVDDQGRTHWYPWNDDEWNRWAASWTPGTTEIEVVRRQLHMTGDPADTAPRG